MRRWIATAGVVMLVAACGPKAGGMASGTGASTGSGSTGGAVSTDGDGTGASGTTGAAEDAVYRVWWPGFDTNGTAVLLVSKSYANADYCVRLSFRYPDINNSGEFGIEFPPDPDWAVNWPPHVVASAECYSEDDSDYADAVAAEGRVWWDEGMCVVDADVELTLPADPRWPTMERISFEGLPVEGREAECAAGGDTGTGG